MEGSSSVPREDKLDDNSWLAVDLSWVDKTGDKVRDFYFHHIIIEVISVFFFFAVEAAGGCRVGSCSQGDEGGWAHSRCQCLLVSPF